MDLAEDVLRWIAQKRFDIIEKLVLNPKFILDPGRYGNTPQWMIDTGHILFGDEEQRCPFLREAVDGEPAGCTIRDLRPRVCDRFPFDMDGRIRAVFAVITGEIDNKQQKLSIKSLFTQMFMVLNQAKNEDTY